MREDDGAEDCAGSVSSLTCVPLSGVRQQKTWPIPELPPFPFVQVELPGNLCSCSMAHMFRKSLFASGTTLKL